MLALIAPLLEMLGEKGRGILGVAAFATVFALAMWVKHAKPSVTQIGDEKLVPTTTDIRLIRPKDATDADVNVKIKLNAPPAGAVLTKLPPLDLHLGVRDNQVYETDKAGKPKYENGTPAYQVSVSNTVHRDWFSSGISDRLDIGTYAGRLSSAHGNVKAFETGVRFGAFRILDTVAFDLVAGSQAAGGGVSLHLPADLAPGFLRNVGLCYYRVFSYRDDGSRNLVALSFSTR